MTDALIDWPYGRTHHVDPEGFLKADRLDKVPRSVPPLCFSSKQAHPLRHDGIRVPVLVVH